MTDRLIKLRPYQLNALRGVETDLRNGVMRPAVTMPTGAGKTVVFAHQAARSFARTQRPTLILVHREELAAQTLNKLAMVAPDLKAGLVKAERNDVDADLIVGSVPTLANVRRMDQLPPLGLIIVDECHHAAAESYRRIMNAQADVPAVGFTATMIRGDGKDLGEIWEKVSFSTDILELIKDGFLVDVRGLQVTVDGLTLGQVTMRGRDFAPMSLGDALRTSEASKFITDAYLEHAPDMPGIVFAPDVATVMDLAEAFNMAGITTAPVWGDMEDTTRRRVLRAYEAGQIQVLVSCMVLTEGFDSPRAQCAVIARPTTNPGLYVQMVGRVLRPYPDKTEALVLDVVGASEEFSLAGLESLTVRAMPDILPGESLMEAVDRERRRRNPNLREGYVTGTREVDLFHRSKLGWLQTEGGVWFLSVPRGLVFLWPDRSEPGHYKVGSVPDYTAEPVPRWHLEAQTLEYAMVWAETTVEEYMTSLGSSEDIRYWSLQRTASWRRRPGTIPQIMYAQALGIDLEPWRNQWSDVRIQRGPLSDLISVKKASTILDRR
jgi:superfamily II DNA or RNA helicase